MRTTSRRTSLRNEGDSRIVMTRREEEKKGENPKHKIKSGSGFVVNAKGVALTALHVVDSCSSIVAAMEMGKFLPATLLVPLPHSDLAIIQLAEKTEPYNHVIFRDSITPEVGKNSYSMGFPLPGLLSQTGNFTHGNISALNGTRNHPHFFQTTNPIQAGNSGGPLFDDNGLLIGMVSYKMDWLTTAFKSGDVPENISFALKGRLLMDRLKTYGVSYTKKTRQNSISPEKLFKTNRNNVVTIRCL